MIPEQQLLPADPLRSLEAMALSAVGDRIPSETDLESIVLKLAAVFGIPTDSAKTVLRALQTKLHIKMDLGISIVEKNHAPWLSARRASIVPFFSNRYQQFLTTRKHWPVAVANSLRRTTDEILDLLGNPVEQAHFKRRGLVLGDVQSGKTATYTSLICSAADAGYRIIVLLAGTMENLRRQTQERLDEGFVGFDSSGELKKKRDGRRVGVGLLDATRQATVFTSRANDFNVATMQTLGLSLAALKEPALVVVKKNKLILENLERWLRDYNAINGKIDAPLLMIDDEADNASVNTRDTSEEDPTAINRAIRQILALFHRTSYIGFTATPFANIFIDPDNTSEMLNDDLFPKDFIYNLSAPSNYVGAEKIFAEANREKFIVNIDDGMQIFPRGHKQTLAVKKLPKSLLTALDCFLVANAIRDIRGEGATHRSMLINVSRFTDVQERVEKLIFDRLTAIRAAVRNFSKLPPEQALDNPDLRALHSSWQAHYSSIADVTWPQIQERLQDSISPIEIAAVNQRTGAASLDYKKHEQNGLRVVAVGGNSLSRGFTLEGLCVSYFLRTSQMYDTLLQMGRWFGYRDNYEEVCRIWLTPEATDWYEHIVDATAELRDEIRTMREQDRTPSDFGLSVRAHPNSLLVTARNKMRTAKLIERVISVSNRLFETIELSQDRNFRLENAEYVRTFLAEGCDGLPRDQFRKGILIRGVGAEHVARLVSRFAVAPSDLLFQSANLGEFIGSNNSPKLKDWDVLIPNGEGRPEKYTGSEVPSEERQVTEHGGAWVISGSKRRIASRGDERAGLDPISVEAIKKAKGDKVSDRDYRSVRERPLLMIHFITPTLGSGKSDPAGKEVPLVGLGVSFCRFDDSRQDDKNKVKYRVNIQKFRELFGEDVEDDTGDAT